tara:strand:+ start:221 stop:394 length:174 start_codon:yes stop_codon:yes gene_type:complete
VGDVVEVDPAAVVDGVLEPLRQRLVRVGVRVRAGVRVGVRVRVEARVGVRLRVRIGG